MAVDKVKEFADWYETYKVDERDGCLQHFAVGECGNAMYQRFDKWRTEMIARTKNYDLLLKLADAEVINPKDDLPNVSSGEVAGMVRRMARNLVQHTPNVDVINEFDDESMAGIFALHTLKTKIIGDELYSNDMQQNLFASAKNSLTLGFDCVIPTLLQEADGAWYMKYDNVYYSDVFPEPGAKDIRQANEVFIRRYLSKGDVKTLIRNNVAGWDIAALKSLLKSQPPVKRRESVDQQNAKHHTIPEGYEIVTWYSNSGDAFLTFDVNSKVLLRIEKNKHPLKWHPVFFLVMEKDLNQPLGKSQVELVLGRQEFQDLMLNGAMKMWYRNINPPLFGYGTTNTVPNLSPGKFTPFSNPNSKVEAFEVNTQTLLQFSSISQQNAGNMGQLIGAADQQMASQSTGGMMSQTPQGVDAQQELVDITTNNYQKAIESFFSKYCSYALTIYFQELKGFKEITPTASTRQELINAGMKPESFDRDGKIEFNMSELATQYYVRSVPGSLIELEDDKQQRLLNEMLIPLSQALPAVAATGDQQSLNKATSAMLYIIEKQLELSGSAHSTEIKRLLNQGVTAEGTAEQEQVGALEQGIGEMEVRLATVEQVAPQMAQLQEQMTLLREGQGAMMAQLGIPTGTTEAEQPTVPV